MRSKKINLFFLLLIIIVFCLSGCSTERPSEREVKKYIKDNFKGKYSVEKVKESDSYLVYNVIFNKCPSVTIEVIGRSGGGTYLIPVPLPATIDDNFKTEFFKYYISEHPLENNISSPKGYYLEGHYDIYDDNEIVSDIKYLLDYRDALMKEENEYRKKKRTYDNSSFEVCNIPFFDDLSDYDGLSDEEIKSLYEKNKFTYLVLNTDIDTYGRYFKNRSEKEYIDLDVIQFLDAYASNNPDIAKEYNYTAVEYESVNIYDLEGL